MTIQQRDQNQPDLHTSTGEPEDVHKIAPRWTAALGAIAVGVLYAALPEKLTYGPNWLPLALIVVVLIPFLIPPLFKKELPYDSRRVLVFLLLGITTFALIASVVLLVYGLPTRTQNNAGISLLRDAGLLWLLNIGVFALWYWEIDGGGPVKRHQNGHRAADLLFPQQQTGHPGKWAPHFVDYLFVAFTGATALSPTDTFPLTRKAKGLMMIEAVLALTILVVVAARAINIL